MFSRSFRVPEFQRQKSNRNDLHPSVTMYTWLTGTAYLCSIDLDTCAAYAFFILSARPLKPAQPGASI